MANPYVKNPTWADGSGGATPISAAKLNIIEQGIYDAHIQPAVRVVHSATQATVSGTALSLAFNTESYDQDGLGTSTMHDTVTNNSRLTAKVAGIYVIHASATWSGSPVNALFEIRFNGGGVIASQQIIADWRTMEVGGHYIFAVNEYVEARVTQSSGGALNINANPTFMMARLG